MSTTAKYSIDTVELKATPEEILKAFNDVISDGTLAFLGEHTSCLSYLPYEYVKPYLKEGITEADWKPKTTEDLREDFRHYRDWWAEKVEGGRGISVHRGKEQFAIRMMLTGMPEWKELWAMDGGWYQEDAYNFVAELFGFRKVVGYRED